jgi:hypothetical protein
MTPSNAEAIMKKTGFDWLCRVLMGAGALVAPVAACAQGEARTLVIHLYDYAKVPDAQLMLAKQEADEVYGHIPVRLFWIRGKPTSEAPPATVHVNVLIMSEAMAKRQTGNFSTTLGVADKPTWTVYIYYNRIAETTGYALIATGRYLGKTIAYEVGHLLLPGGHSKAGIMRAYLGANPYDHERFNDAQTSAIWEKLTPSIGEGNEPEHKRNKKAPICQALIDSSSNGTRSFPIGSFRIMYLKPSKST